MIVYTHDPKEYIRGLQQLLVSDKKKIAFLFGAGTSLGKKNNESITIPAMRKMTEEIENALSSREKFRLALDEIKMEIGEKKYNIESLLSNMEQKKDVIGKGILNGLELKEFECLLKAIKNQIRQKVNINDLILSNNNIDNLLHADFAEWIGRADRKYPIEIFTTNYDYLFELGLEEKGIPYYDGFTGSYMPFFNSESVEDLKFLTKQTKLWKIHGSLGWQLDSEKQRVLRKESNNKDILIYPSTLKYNDSKKQPYTALMDRLTNFLRQPDSILITCGYSFNDEHINERILTALKSNTTSHVFALYRDKPKMENGKFIYKPESKLFEMAKKNSKISIYSNRYAVIGCNYGIWKLKKEPDYQDTINTNLYFDEDAPFNPEDEINVLIKGKEIWTGKGEFILTDFSKFVRFLINMIVESDLGKGVKNE